MPGIGWNCQCGTQILEGINFYWKFECAKLNCSKENHSSECCQKDWQAKEAELKQIVDKHLAICDKSCKCFKCNKPFKYGETYTKVSNDSKAGDYHYKCWEEIKKEEDIERERAKSLWEVPKTTSSYSFRC